MPTPDQTPVDGIHTIQAHSNWDSSTVPSEGITHVVHDDGLHVWYKNGVRHRDNDLPAVEHPGSPFETKQWFQNGERHREGGKPAVISPYGKQWFEHDALHRDGGPAMDFDNGEQHWYQHGLRHREDGPARFDAGGIPAEWWENGVRVPSREPAGTSLEVKLGTNKLRQLRDHIESKGGLVGRKDLPAQLPDEIKPLLTPRGELSSKKIQEFLDSKPGLKFGTTETEWNGAQRHNDQPSKVMQLNVTPEQRQQLKAAGVHDTFESMMETSRQSHHPVGQNTVGWVRYTKPDDDGDIRAEAHQRLDNNGGNDWSDEDKNDYVNGHLENAQKEGRINTSPSIFMDEVQSDFGQSFGKQVVAQAHQEALNNIERGTYGYGPDSDAHITSDSPEEYKNRYVLEHVARARAEAEKKWPEAHQQKIKEILFGGRHPNEVLHEAFHEHMRQKGHVGTPVSIWTSDSKAPLSDMDPDKPLPGHMKMTYDQLPQKMGMSRSLYGIPAHADTEKPLRPAESGDHHSQPIWTDVIRKREPHLKHIAALAVVNPQGLLLFQRRCDNQKWTQPAGHLEPGESAEQGARRELLEETDLVPHRCEYLGSGALRDRGLVIHCYRAHVDGRPSAKNDPDKEAQEFRWVDVSQGLPPDIAGNLHSPDNVLLKLLGLQDDLTKGAMQRLAPFNPQNLQDRLSDRDETELARWQFGDPEDARPGFADLPGVHLRGLHRLSAATQVRKNPDTGEHEYLLHRGMSPEEYQTVVSGDRINHENPSSWTPKRDVARGFGNRYGEAGRTHTVAAWIPKSSIAFIPKHYGKLDSEADIYSADEGYKPPQGANNYDREYEVVVHGGHNSLLASPEELKASNRPGETLHGRVNARTGWSKSELLLKSPAPWAEPASRFEEFARQNLAPQSPQLVHAGSHQIGPQTWVHKYEESKAFKLAPGSTRKLTEYRITQNRDPRQEKAWAVLGGTAHEDKGVKKFRVSSFAVDQKARRHGLGRVLYEHVLRDNGGRTESDTMVSPSAQGFYEGLARDKKYRVKFGDQTADTRHSVELSKSLKNGLMALATVAVMAPGVVGAHEPKTAGVSPHYEANMSPAPAKTKWGSEGLHPELYPIAHLESNMGQNMEHARHSKGVFHTAYGALGMKPITAFERYHHEPHLQTLFPGVGEDKDKFLTEMKANPLFYNAIASAEWSHNKKVFGGDIHRSAFAWRWGKQAAHDATAEVVIADPYVKMFDKLNNRLKSREELAKSVQKEHAPRMAPKLIYHDVRPVTASLNPVQEFRKGLNLYDIGDDVLGLAKSETRQTSFGPVYEPLGIADFEKKLKRLGFQGYSNYVPGNPEAIAVFKPVVVKQEV